MTATAALPRLLAGPPSQAGAEHLAAHRARLGDLPPIGDRREIVTVIEASGLLGRGGAAFPVGRKWRAVAERSAGDAVVVVNGAEGEPRSARDRVLMSCRPHLVLDGALVAADAVGANEIIVYVGSEHRDAHAALGRALAERALAERARVRLVAAPVGYVAGEATAAVHFLNTGDARPTFLEQRPHEAGVGGRPTLVQNVESLAYAALIARHGDAWYRSVGRGQTRGTALVTVSGAVPQPGVHEIEYGTTLGEVATLAGLAARDASAVLVGGYFGGWASLDEVAERPLDPADRAADRIGFGCGVVSFAGPETCGVRATAEIMTFMAGQSAAQCGPCVFGLAAIADATRRLAVGPAAADDLRRIDRWAARSGDAGRATIPTGRRACCRAPSASSPTSSHATRRGAGAPWRAPRSPEMADVLRVDPIRCDGYGMCAELLPELITLDDWGYPVIAPGPVPERLLDHARRAVDVCPVLALRLQRAPAARRPAPVPTTAGAGGR